MSPAPAHVEGIRGPFRPTGITQPVATKKEASQIGYSLEHVAYHAHVFAATGALLFPASSLPAQRILFHSFVWREQSSL